MIKALVLIGGKSKRLGRAKHLIDFHGLPQYKYLCDQLETLGIEYYISCNSDQSNDLMGLPTIEDKYPEIGPKGGILSAFETYPESAWLVLACDLPFVNISNIKFLLDQRNPKNLVTTYRVSPKFLETTFTIYEKETYSLFLESYDQGDYSLQSIMKSSKDINALEPLNLGDLFNVNSPQDLEQARNLIQKRN
ncbi:MAG: NTP transferase domain-containing protein [bacterium]|nr:NTP transferase domain-containing protein [bacterium]